MTKPPFPPMTPERLIALLVALGERRTKGGQTVYTLTLDDIHEADAILNGSFDPEAEE